MKINLLIEVIAITVCLEDEILHLLSASEGDVLEDDTLALSPAYLGSTGIVKKSFLHGFQPFSTAHTKRRPDVEAKVDKVTASKQVSLDIGEKQEARFKRRESRFGID